MKCESCKKEVGKSIFGSMCLNKRNYKLFGKSHMDLCYNCMSDNDLGKKLKGGK
jgi:hypothetical protein